MKKLILQFINEWTQIKGKWNWKTFTFIEISFESDIMCPGYEVMFILLGIGLRIRVNKSWEGTEIQNALDEIDLEKYKQ